jgi:hypothetical protein
MHKSSTPIARWAIRRSAAVDTASEVFVLFMSLFFYIPVTTTDKRFYQ